MNSWTVVTGYFDLTKMPDASPSIHDRPSTHYLENAVATMNLDQNLIVFCEPDTLSELQALRPTHLVEKTKFITVSFEDFTLTKYRNKILENRSLNADHDDRNTASYYLLCMARYAMLKRVIAENPFGSTHFAWLNICIQRMGPKNVEELPRVFSGFRDKFSTCYIDYIPRDQVISAVRNGRCSMCSGFFTGRADYMKRFCDEIEEKFLHYLDLGLGHADEQLYSPVYFDSPEIFEVYYGDYTEMITNYTWIQERASEPLRLLIRGSFAAGDYVTCLPACVKLWNSFKKGCAQLQSLEVIYLIFFYRSCLHNLGLPEELA
jgi:hypothetical protein